MAAYRRVYDSRHLQADCQEPGTAPEPYARQSSMGYLSFFAFFTCWGGSVAKWKWLACWTQAQKARVQIASATLSGNSLRQTVNTHRASVHQAAKLVANLVRVAGVTAGLAESNSSLPPGL